MSEDMLPVAEAAAREFQPDVIMVDEICPAGAIIAEKLRIPWVTSASTGQLHSREIDRLPMVKAWIEEKLRRLCSSAGVPGLVTTGISEDLVLLYTSRALAGEDHTYPSHYHFIGPVPSERKTLGDFPWDELTGDTIVFASVGTLYRYQGEHLLQAVAEGLAGEPMQVVMAGGRDAIENPPANFLMVDWAPQIDLLPKVDAVITHGGLTVEESLSFGLPLVVAPIAQDQFILADQVVRAGAGLRLRADRASGDDVRRAVQAVLHEPQYREAAKRIQRSFQETGGATAAADAIEALTRSRPSEPGPGK
jgi:MGT family glycosyltransferase